MAYYYITFADDEEFRGATVVKAISPDAALQETIRLNINPGGEAIVMFLPVADSDVEVNVRSMINRLIGMEEMRRDYTPISLDKLSQQASELIDSFSTVYKQKPN